jgi:hemolysin III
MAVQVFTPNLKQELANSISHAFGMLFGIIGMPILIATAVKNGNTTGLVGASIFGFSFLMVYTASTLYHGFQHPEVKRVLKIIDHISIYFLIAGSYTPFILLFYFNPTGIVLLAVLWSLTLLGIIFKIFFVDRFTYLSTVIYLLMGWMLLFIIKPFFANLPLSITVMLTLGGVLYSLGVIFFLWTKYFYHHLVWHIFVLAASICHFVAVLLAVS